MDDHRKYNDENKDNNDNKEIKEKDSQGSDGFLHKAGSISFKKRKFVKFFLIIFLALFILIVIYLYLFAHNRSNGIPVQKPINKADILLDKSATLKKLNFDDLKNKTKNENSPAMKNSEPMLNKKLNKNNRMKRKNSPLADLFKLPGKQKGRTLSNSNGGGNSIYEHTANFNPIQYNSQTVSRPTGFNSLISRVNKVVPNFNFKNRVLPFKNSSRHLTVILTSGNLAVIKLGKSPMFVRQGEKIGGYEILSVNSSGIKTSIDGEIKFIEVKE